MVELNREVRPQAQLWPCITQVRPWSKEMFKKFWLRMMNLRNLDEHYSLVSFLPRAATPIRELYPVQENLSLSLSA